jgi:hypothetical protein
VFCELDTEAMIGAPVQACYEAFYDKACTQLHGRELRDDFRLQIFQRFIHL